MYALMYGHSHQHHSLTLPRANVSLHAQADTLLIPGIGYVRPTVRIYMLIRWPARLRV